MNHHNPIALTSPERRQQSKDRRVGADLMSLQATEVNERRVAQQRREHDRNIAEDREAAYYANRPDPSEYLCENLDRDGWDD